VLSRWAANSFLKCPAWKWEGGDPKKAVSYLPKDKQFLITRNVPCAERASDLQKQAERTTYKDVEVEGDEGWVCDEEGAGGADAEAEDVPTMGAASAKPAANNAGDEDDDDDGEIPDMDSYSNEDNIDEAAVAAPAGDKDHLVQSRSYDISITYDNYYATPKMWLFGYSETGAPLTPQEIFSDISEDHARKTVTMDHHPHLENRTFAFIHPCKHSAVIKSLIDRMAANGHVPRVDHYLFIFLKFMSAVIPTIEYDLSPDIVIGGK
jgi:ubiquitin-like-conjugating enzyme ATG3